MIAVAVAVIQDESGRVLLSQRQSHQDFADCWEFPGGKVEPGESALQALQREMQEELGLVLMSAQPLIEIPWHYAHKSVCLQCFCVTQWQGNAHGMEGQQLKWVDLAELSKLSMPEANAAIVPALLAWPKGIISG